MLDEGLISAATFTSTDHCSSPGWATYWKWRNLDTGFRGLVCLFRGHDLPDRPDPADGHSPNNYAHCRRCDAPMKWFVRGQHRYGGLEA